MEKQTKERNWFFFHLLETYGLDVAERYWDVKIGAWAKRNKELIKIEELGSYEWQGKKGDAKYWATELGIAKVTFYDRIRKYGICEKSFLPNQRLTPLPRFKSTKRKK